MPERSIEWESEGEWRISKVGSTHLYAAPFADGSACEALVIVNGRKMHQSAHATRDEAMAAAETYARGPIEVRHLEADGNVDLAAFHPPLVDGNRLRPGDTLLLLAQADPAENGVYILGEYGWGGVVPLTRVTDFKIVGGPGYRMTVTL